MAHARQVLRDYVAAQLSAVGIPVSIGKAYMVDFETDEINILTSSESRNREWARPAGSAGSYPDVYDCVLTVEVRAMDATNVLDVLDSYAATIQAALATDLVWGGNVKIVRLDSTESELSAESQKPSGLLTMTYAVTYEVDNRAPSVPL